MDTVLLFKVGKFYEMYHMDAEIGVRNLGFSFMKVRMWTFVSKERDVILYLLFPIRMLLFQEKAILYRI